MPPHAPQSGSPRRRTAAAAALLLAATLTACGDDPEAPAASEPESQSVESETPPPAESPSATPSETPSGTESEQAGPALEVEVEGDEVKPVAERVDLAVGERLTITVKADRAGELHVHSDPEHSFDFGPGTKTFRLTLDTPGSVDIEEHESDALVARVLVR